MSNAADDVFRLAGSDPERALFSRKTAGSWHSVSAKEFAAEVVAVAKGLVAAGIRAGDRVALMSATRYEWVLADYALWTMGAVSVPVCETDSAERVAWILADSGALAAIAENAAAAALVDPVGGPIWSIEDGGLAELAAQGRAQPAGAVEARRAVEPEAPATIVYTSGTTARPRGCLITHGNLVSEVDSIMRAEGVDTVLTPDSAVLLSLPLADILARIVQLAAVRAGASTAHTAASGDLEHEFVTFRPTLIVAAPWVFEKFFDAVARRAETERRAWLFGLAERAAIAYSEHGRARLAHRLFDRLVYQKLRDALGGRVAYVICGGAPLSERQAHFLRGAGLPVLEGYGLTETCGPVTLNPPFSPWLGTVGRPLPYWSVRITGDGEVLVSGPGVFAGYWRDETATRAAFATKGWLRTGDLGELHDGYLTVTGRGKNRGRYESAAGVMRP